MKKQLIVGMPASGKSTFIGALRHILVAEDVDTALELTALANDEKHINMLEDRWLSCQEMERTKTSNEAWVELQVRDKASGTESLLVIPDLRGENFERPAAIGACPKDLHDALIGSDGILLFTNVGRPEDMLLIDDFGDLDPDEDDHTEATETKTAEQTNEPPSSPPPSFRPEDMAEEVKMVEFLQMANRRPLHPKKRKIAVLASAWDIVEDEKGLTPDIWFEQKRPMLAQYLSYNPELWQVRIYGVSAQGGQFPQKRAEFEKMYRQSERVRMIGHGAAIHDLSAPLRWLLTPK